MNECPPFIFIDFENANVHLSNKNIDHKCINYMKHFEFRSFRKFRVSNACRLKNDFSPYSCIFQMYARLINCSLAQRTSSNVRETRGKEERGQQNIAANFTTVHHGRYRHFVAHLANKCFPSFSDIFFQCDYQRIAGYSITDSIYSS